MAKLQFGTTGIRGDAEKLFTNQFSFDVGRAFGKFLKNHNRRGEVAIGMDPRESSPRIKKAISSGLMYEGYDVLDQGVIPIPAVNYILIAKPYLAGSLMISGSHIKPHLNGVKLFAFGEEIMKEHEKELEEEYLIISEKVEFREIGVPEKDNSAKEEYQNYLVGKASEEMPRYRVVVDPGNGAQSDVMPWVLEKIGLNVIEINASVQNEFYSRDTEVQGDFKELQEKVKEAGADFGIGYDSDGDRAIFIDENGVFIPGDYTGSIISEHTDGDNVVTPINSSQVVEMIGKTVYRTKVGSSQVISKMKSVGANFGFEANGGGIFKDMMSRDGGRTTIEIINILAELGKTLSELVMGYPKFYISRDKVDFKWEMKDKIIEKAKEKFKGEKIDETDGLKIWMNENTWILFRSSTNAPEFRVFVESTSESRSKELLSQGIELVNKIIKNG